MTETKREFCSKKLVTFIIVFSLYKTEYKPIIIDMRYFWTHTDKIPEGMGYGQFTKKHFIWITILTLFVAGIVFIYSQMDMQGRILLLRSIGATLIIIDIIKLILIAASGGDVYEFFPLELCSFAAYSIVCDSIWIGNTIFPIMLLTLFMPAAFMAVLFPTTSTLPAVNFYTIHQFLYHGLIIAYVVARFVCKEIPLDYPGVWKSIFYVILLAAVIYVIDKIFHKDFMFLVDDYDNPLLKVITKVTGGGFAYTVGLVLFCIFMIQVFYILFKIINILFLA